MTKGSFTLQLEEFVRATKEKAHDAVGLVVAKVAAEVDLRSPVGDGTYWISPPPKGYVGGRFRANWQLGIGAPDWSTTEQVDTSPKNEVSGGTTTQLIVSKLPEQAAGKVYYLTNSLPYAQRIEEGWSRQAPQGVVGLTVIKFQEWVNEAVEQLNAKG